MTSEPSFSDVLKTVAARQPAPGGGAVAAWAGAMASALGRMVCAYSGKSFCSENSRNERVAEATERLERAQSLFLEFAEADAAAFSRLQELENSESPDAGELKDAAARAAGVPMAVLIAAASVLGDMERLAPHVNLWMFSDLAIVAILADATARSAAWMVDANLPAVTRCQGQAEADRLRAERDSALAALPARLAAVLDACRGHVPG